MSSTEHTKFKLNLVSGGDVIVKFSNIIQGQGYSLLNMSF